MNCFEQLFKNFDLSPDAIEKCTNDVASVVLITLIGVTGPKLTTEQKQVLGNSLKKRDAVQTINLIRAAYSDGEWSEVVKEHVQPLIEGYVKEVLV